MSGPAFFQTLLGKRFFESDIPRLVKAAERIAGALERLADAAEGKAPSVSSPTPPSTPERPS